MVLRSCFKTQNIPLATLIRLVGGRADWRSSIRNQILSTSVLCLSPSKLR